MASWTGVTPRRLPKETSGGLWARVTWATTEALYGSNCEMDGTEATRADQRPAPSAMADSSLKLDRPPAAGSLALA